MLNTTMLAHEITDIIKKCTPEVNLENIHFCSGDIHSPEGIYVYSENGLYYYRVVEKGHIEQEYRCRNVQEVLWYVLENVLFETALKYTQELCTAPKNFRKTLLQQEAALFSRYGEPFYSRKREEISKLWKQYPD